MVKHWMELVILMACLIFTGFVSSLLLGVLGIQTIDEPLQTSTYIQSAIITQTVMFFGGAILYFKVTGINWKSYIYFGLLENKHLILTGIFFIAALVLTLSFSPVTSLIESYFKDHPWVLYQAKVNALQNDVLGSLRGAKIAIALLVFALLPAIAEEIVFRGLLYKILKDIFSKKQLAMVLSAIIFAVFHFQILSFLPILVVGYLLALLYEKTSNIITGILLHFLFNAIQIVFLQA